MTLKRTIVSAFAAFSAFLTACSGGVNFTGTAQEPLPEGASVETIMSPDDLPYDRVEIGKINFIASPKTARFDVYKILRDEAAKRGANTVYIVSMNKVNGGDARFDQLTNGTAPGWMVEDNSEMTHKKVHESIENSEYANLSSTKQVWGFDVRAEIYYSRSVEAQQKVAGK